MGFQFLSVHFVNEWCLTSDLLPQKVDYLKIDSCGVDGPGSEWDQFAAMRDALNATGRPVYVSVCEITPYNSPQDACHGGGGVV